MACKLLILFVLFAWLAALDDFRSWLIREARELRDVRHYSCTHSTASRQSGGWSRSTSTNTTRCCRIRRFADRRRTKCTSARETRCRRTSRHARVAANQFGVVRDVPVTQHGGMMPSELITVLTTGAPPAPRQSSSDAPEISG